jgi:RND family efflux transporter MFP subunit
MTRSFLLRLIIVLLLLAGGAFAGFYFLRPVVTVAPVRRDTAASAVPGTVTVRAERTYLVVTEVSGRIVKNELKVGQQVKAGDLLVKIDDRSITNELRQVGARLDALNRRIAQGPTRKFELEGARELLTYRRELLESQVIPAADVSAQERTVASIEQQIELERAQQELEKALAEASLDSLETTLAKTELRSPIDGVVSRVEAFEGDLVGGNTIIAEIVSLTRIVDVKISEENNAAVTLGQPATVRLASYGSEKFPATVSKLATTADPETQRYVVELEVSASVDKLVPGMTGEAVITVDERENALLIPRPALVGNHVFVIQDGRAERREVSVGFTALNEAEILEGLQENEWVAVDQLDVLSDGTAVRTVETR